MDRHQIIRIVLLVCALIAGAWFYTLDLSSDYRMPNERERFFQYAAVEANVPELCEKISPRAIVVSGFGSDGRRVYSSRSHCFHQTAVRHSDSLLCLKVKSVNNIAHWGYKISTLGCWLEIREQKRKGSPSAIVPRDKMVMTMFNEMGYTIDGAVDALPLKPMVNLGRAFGELYKQPDITKRLMAAVKLKNNIPLEDFELLSEMLAKHTHDIKWCKNIRPGVRHPAEKKSEQKWKNDYRGNCILHAAIGSGNEKYCDELPNKPVVPGQPKFWWPANDCRSSVRHEKQRKKSARPSYTGYHVPEDKKQTLRLFGHLGYNLPKDSDQSIDKLARRYRYLLSGIGDGEVSRDDARVTTLLQRLRQLNIKERGGGVTTPPATDSLPGG